jgi:hypothetical protein
MIQSFFLFLSFFVITPIFTSVPIVPNEQNSIQLQYSKKCLPQLEGPHILSWEETTEIGINKGEIVISTAPPQPNGYTIQLPTQANLKQFNLKTTLLGGEELNCKIDPSKNIKIDAQDTMVIHRITRCFCIQ